VASKVSCRRNFRNRIYNSGLEIKKIYGAVALKLGHSQVKICSQVAPKNYHPTIIYIEMATENYWLAPKY